MQSRENSVIRHPFEFVNREPHRLRGLNRCGEEFLTTLWVSDHREPLGENCFLRRALFTVALGIRRRLDFLRLRAEFDQLLDLRHGRVVLRIRAHIGVRVAQSQGLIRLWGDHTRKMVNECLRNAFDALKVRVHRLARLRQFLRFPRVIRLPQIALGHFFKRGLRSVRQGHKGGLRLCGVLWLGFSGFFRPFIGRLGRWGLHGVLIFVRVVVIPFRCGVVLGRVGAGRLNGGGIVFDGH